MPLREIHVNFTCPASTNFFAADVGGDATLGLAEPAAALWGRLRTLGHRTCGPALLAVRRRVRSARPRCPGATLPAGSRPPSPLPTVALASLCPPHHAPCCPPPCTSRSPHVPSPPPPSPPPPPRPPPPSPLAIAALTASSRAMHLAEDALPHRDQDPALRPHLARPDQLDLPQQRGRR